jgi:hypothetical protein
MSESVGRRRVMVVMIVKLWLYGYGCMPAGLCGYGCVATSTIVKCVGKSSEKGYDVGDIYLMSVDV